MGELVFWFHGVHNRGTYTETVCLITVFVISVISFSVWDWKILPGNTALCLELSQNRVQTICLIVCGLLQYCFKIKFPHKISNACFSKQEIIQHFWVFFICRCSWDKRT